MTLNKTKPDGFGNICIYILFILENTEPSLKKQNLLIFHIIVSTYQKSKVRQNLSVNLHFNYDPLQDITCRLFHMRHHEDTEKVLDSRAFQIVAFPVRNAWPVVMHSGLEI